MAPVTEPHLQPSAKLNYSVYRKDTDDTPGEGTAIVVRKVIKHSEILQPTLQHMEATAIQLSINKSLVTLNSIYKPPGKIVETDIQLLIKASRKEIPAGNSDAKHVTWNYRKKNAAGQVLLNHYNKNDHIITAPVSATHIPDGIHSTPEVIDFAVLNIIISQHMADPSGRAAQGVGSNPTGGMDVSVVSVVCCQVEVSATD